MIILVGAGVAVLATFPVAALCALVFRFPVPFAGYMSGVQAVGPALLAVAFYGAMFGGFAVQAALGGLAAIVARRVAGSDERRARRLLTLLAVFASVPGVFTLAILDKIIGPW